MLWYRVYRDFDVEMYMVVITMVSIPREHCFNISTFSVPRQGLDLVP